MYGGVVSFIANAAHEQSLQRLPADNLVPPLLRKSESKKPFDRKKPQENNSDRKQVTPEHPPKQHNHPQMGVSFFFFSRMRQRQELSPVKPSKPVLNRITFLISRNLARKIELAAAGNKKEQAQWYGMK